MYYYFIINTINSTSLYKKNDPFIHEAVLRETQPETFLVQFLDLCACFSCGSNHLFDYSFRQNSVSSALFHYVLVLVRVGHYWRMPQTLVPQELPGIYSFKDFLDDPQQWSIPRFNLPLEQRSQTPPQVL